MHSYLRAIGFSKYKSRRHLEQIYRETLKAPNRKIITTVSVDTSLLQFEKDFAASMGLALIGECDIEGNISIEHYFPYLKGNDYYEYDRISIEKQTDKESYAGICEDYRLGMTLIFYVINIADYAKSKWFNYSNRTLSQVKFSGLSISGTILLGVNKTDRQQKAEFDQNTNRNNMIAAAKNGNREAIDNLTIDEMDTYSLISSRLANEDIFSIVSTTFMPYGVECDHYMIIGNILHVEELVNKFTDETIYNLLVDVNDITINVGINKDDLLGEPKEGRRFKGEIWLQGIVRI